MFIVSEELAHSLAEGFDRLSKFFILRGKRYYLLLAEFQRFSQRLEIFVENFHEI